MEQVREEHPLKWAVFLGVSWTWCIGMFLPVLLVRDLGTWAWWAFAIPNVVGAAAMGWVLRSSERSVELVARHWHACAVFSAVTIVFHLFFLVWMVQRLLEARLFYLVVLLLLAITALVVTTRWGDWMGGLAVFAGSLFAWGLSWDHLDYEAVSIGGRGGIGEALMLSPVCVLGFALCPYLDLTFHRARQRVGAEGAKVAFGIGFGVVFFSMIVFTLGYAELLTPVIEMPNANRLLRGVAVAIGLHLGMQSAITIAYHLREVLPTSGRMGAGVVLAIGAALLLLRVGWGAGVRERWFDLSAGEVIYRHFMGFYGFVFPAYAWLCMFNSRGTERQRLMAFAASVLIALPMGFMAFVMNRFIWTLPAVGVIVAAPLVLPRSRVDPSGMSVDHAAGS